MSVNNFDCDDTDATVYLGRVNCVMVKSIPVAMYWIHQRRTLMATDVVCSIDPSGWDGAGTVIGDGDCDDNDRTYPNALQVCDGVDSTCTTSVPADELDNDGDGYVECSVSTPWSGIIGGGDCDDTTASISPNASELCDGIPNVCGATLPSTETDDDGDGYVECSVSTPWSGIIGGGDCDDTTVNISPVATQLCDGIPNTCGAPLPSNETDDDGDGYVECSVSTPWSGITGGSDCDDNNATIFECLPSV